MTTQGQAYFCFIISVFTLSDGGVDGGLVCSGGQRRVRAVVLYCFDWFYARSSQDCEKRRLATSVACPGIFFVGGGVFYKFS
jgi:hypothetical protein